MRKILNNIYLNKSIAVADIFTNSVLAFGILFALYFLFQPLIKYKAKKLFENSDPELQEIYYQMTSNAGFVILGIINYFLLAIKVFPIIIFVIFFRFIFFCCQYIVQDIKNDKVQALGFFISFFALILSIFTMFKPNF